MGAARQARNAAMEKHASPDTGQGKHAGTLSRRTLRSGPGDEVCMISARPSRGKRRSGGGGVAVTHLQASPNKEKANPHKGIKLVLQNSAREQALL